MDIKELRARIARTGIATLNPMQEAAAVSGARSLVIIAPTGSGKTLAYAVAMLKRLTAPTGCVQAVVIAPSRELVMQIHSVIRPIATGLKTVCFYGGHPFSAEQSSVEGGVPDIVIATPGRLADHLNRRTVDLSGVSALVVDEYDKTLELGFQEEVGRIVRRLKRLTFTALTSATAPESLPAFIEQGRMEVIDYTALSAAPSVMVMEVPSPSRDKLDTLVALLGHVEGSSMVFVNHRESAERVAQALKKRGIAVILYHGGLDQHDRELAVAAFRGGGARVLVATDLAARGLDIAGVDAVMHYHMPVDEAAWTHRNGRTARAGATGDVYVITGPDEPVPGYVVVHHPFYPDMEGAQPKPAEWTVLYINAGKREKISRGDVAGFVMKQCGVPASDVGVITVGLDYSLVSVRPGHVSAVIDASHSARLKNKRVRVSTL